MSNPRIALVGHCGPDAYMLRSAILYQIKDAQVVFVNDTSSLDREIETGLAGLLINRVLEYGFDFQMGNDLIRNLKIKSPQLKLMLISDYPDAQEQALQLGALPGFGKKNVGSAKMKEALSGLIA